MAPSDEPITFPGDAVEAPSYNEALRLMARPDFFGSERHTAQRHRAVREHAHPQLLLFEKTFIRRMAKLRVPMFASEVIRTRERQDDLFALGVTKARGGRSPHQFGLAIDLVHGTLGWQLDKRQWALIGHVGRQAAASIGVKIRWGGDWDGDGGPVDWDPAHWELAAAKVGMPGTPSYRTVKGWRTLATFYPRWEGLPADESAIS